MKSNQSKAKYCCWIKWAKNKKEKIQVFFLIEIISAVALSQNI